MPERTNHQSELTHGIQHPSECHLTFSAYAEQLAEYHEQLCWLRSLFSAIQADEDVEEGFQIFHLAQIGDHLADVWINQMDVRRREIDAIYAKSLV